MSGMIIMSNILALNAKGNLNRVGRKGEKAAQRLSSGYRINSAADDAAGLAMSEKMRAQIRGLDQAERNAQDGINLLKTADGALEGVDSMLIRMRELAIYALNDVNNDDDKMKINEEIQHLKQEINHVSERTSFNNKISV
jgi:flagellin